MQYFLDPSAFYLIGRTLTAAFGAATVLLVYLMARRRGDRERPDGALLLTVTAMHVENSHFITSDVPMTFLVALALYIAMGFDARTWPKFAAGAMVGLAMAMKYTAVLTLPFLLLANGFWGVSAAARPATG